MKDYQLAFVAALGAMLLQGSTTSAYAETLSERVDQLDHSRISALLLRAGWSQCPEKEPGASAPRLPLEQRLNRLVLDDNLRVLRRIRGTTCGKNSVSFKAIEELVGQLSNRDLPAKQRWEAAQHLTEKPHVIAVLAVPALVQAFNSDPDISVRNYSALALVKIDPRSAIPQLINGLESSDSDIRQLSASAIHSAGAAAVPILMRLVKCADPHMKNLGCLALAEVGAPAVSCLGALRSLSNDADADGTYVQTAVESISRIQNEVRLGKADSVEIAFDPELWQGTDQEFCRPAMVHHILSHGLLIGKTAREVQNLLGRAISFDHGREFRYNVGVARTGSSKRHAAKKSETNSGSSEVNDAYLVLLLTNGVVASCELKQFNQLDWDAQREDKLPNPPGMDSAPGMIVSQARLTDIRTI